MDSSASGDEGKVLTMVFCGLCGDGFTRLSNLKRHYRSNKHQDALARAIESGPLPMALSLDARNLVPSQLKQEKKARKEELNRLRASGLLVDGEQCLPAFHLEGKRPSCSEDCAGKEHDEEGCCGKTGKRNRHPKLPTEFLLAERAKGLAMGRVPGLAGDALGHPQALGQVMPHAHFHSLSQDGSAGLQPVKRPPGRPPKVRDPNAIIKYIPQPAAFATVPRIPGTSEESAASRKHSSFSGNGAAAAGPAVAAGTAALLTISPAASAPSATERKGFYEHRREGLHGETPLSAPSAASAAAPGAHAAPLTAGNLLGAQRVKPSAASALSSSVASAPALLSGHAVTASHALAGGQPQAENSLAESLSLSPKPQVFKPHQRIAPLSLGDDGWISFYDSPTMRCADSNPSDDENDSASKPKRERTLSTSIPDTPLKKKRGPSPSTSPTSFSDDEDCSSVFGLLSDDHLSLLAGLEAASLGEERDIVAFVARKKNDLKEFAAKVASMQVRLSSNHSALLLRILATIHA